MIFDQTTRTIGVFPSIETAGEALDRLVLQGFPLKNLFLVGNNLADCVEHGGAIKQVKMLDQQQIGTISGTAQGLTKGLIAGNMFGSVAGVVLGLGILALPGIGQIAFPTAAMFTLLSGGVGIAAGGVIGALIGLGLTEHQAKQCSANLAQGRYLLIVNGTPYQVHRAEQILDTQCISR